MTPSQTEAASQVSDATTKLKLLYMAVGLGELKGPPALKQLSAIIEQLSKASIVLNR